MRRFRFAAMVVSVTALIAGCTSTGTTRLPPSGSSSPPVSSSPSVGSLSTGTRWLIAASAIGKLADVAGSAVVARYLDGPQTTIITGPDILASLANWDVHFALDAKSLKEIRLGVSGSLSPRITMILYDPEHWSFTPIAEQSAVGSSTETAAAIAHSAGRRLIVAPATNLARKKTPGESAANAFLQTNDLEKVAHSADWVEIQAQGLERDPERYVTYIKKALRQIRLVNPKTMVYAGLSTNPSGPPVDAAELVEDVKLTSSAVNGYWLNIPSPGAACPLCGQPQPQIAISLLESLARN
jgi:hypothetical protein